MTRSVTRFTAATLAAFVVYAYPQAARQVTPETPDLKALFTAGRGLVHDTNGDGLADAVAARIVVPVIPSREDSLAAANLAARLGFETTALSLPLVVTDAEAASLPSGTVPILIGRTNRHVQALAGRNEVALAALEPGQGVIAAVRNPVGQGAAVVIAGGDDEGTLSAAVEASARLPRLWSMTGVTLSGIADQVAAQLRSAGADTRALAVTSVVVDREKRGLASVTVRATVPVGRTSRAVQAFEALDRAHRRGLDPETLAFSEVGQTIVELVSESGVSRAVVNRSGLNSRTLTPPIDPSELAPDSPGERGRPADAGPATGGRRFDLADTYTIDGWYGDQYSDLIPDRTDATIVVGSAADAIGAAHIAARLGLETTGMSFPVARPDGDVRDAAREGPPILVGRDNRLTKNLEKIGKARLDGLKPGEGVVQVVPNAFGAVTATVVAGADPAGTEAAAMYLGRRLPHVWDNARGALSIDDVREEVADFLGGKSAAGQASQAIREVQTLLESLKGESVESFSAKLFLESADPAVDKALADRVTAALGSAATVSVTSQAITAPTPVIDETIEVPWEVDDVRAQVTGKVVPAVNAGSRVDLEVRVSESPEVRKALAEELRAALTRAGARDPKVRVLSAYKQGYMWLTEEVLPQLKGRGVRALHVKTLTYKPDLAAKQKFYQVPTRWMHELYPVDEIVQRELGIARDRFVLEMVDEASDVYSVDAIDGAGKVLQTFRFSPKFVAREYLDKFPGWAKVDVTTGWLRATVDDTTVVDARVQTDPERFWDQYQSKVLPRVYDHVMRVTNNQPLPAKQPFFRDFDIEVWMSEPDFRIGVDEELVSSLESLHEDLYFDTLDFFDALGRTTTKQRLAGPGKVFPIIHPERRGRAGTVHVLYAGNASTKPSLEIEYRKKGTTAPEKVTKDLGKIETTAPVIARAVVRQDGVSELEVQVEARDDAQASRAADALDGLADLRALGLYRTALSLPHVDRLTVTVDLRDAHTRRTLASTGTFAPSNVRTATAKPSLPVVTWDHIIGPDESEAIVAKLAAYPEARAYKAGKSFRGRDVSILELTIPAGGELVSLAKLTALKPTIFITGRQHANEVSSTSHILKLAELMVTDGTYRDLLKKVNVVLQPVENPDGAAMHYELQKLTPSHMLHAGRYSALGMDVASQVNVAEPLLPESRVRGRVWQEWLPDIYLNPHGYPSHEWVQQFAGYVPPGFRSYWTTRGWYTSVGGLRDPRYPEHETAVAALREAIVREINKDADVKAMNLRSQARYARWAFGFAPYVYGQEIYKDTAIYYTDPETGEVRGSRRAGTGTRTGGRAAMNQWPQVTFVSGGTETPDETAQAPWLELVTKPGFSYLMAHITYLRDGRFQVERIEENAPRDGSSITLLRVRPVRPGASAGTNHAAGTR